MNPLDLSIIIITRNEEDDLKACLESVKNIGSEVILVDSGSTDRTLEIARRYTDKIFHHEWSGYSQQKQFALNHATKTWVLNIDADERVTSPLAEEIQTMLSTALPSDLGGFQLPYRHFFLGRRLRFGGIQGETHVRLFKRKAARYGAEKIHEGIHVEGTLGLMKHPIDHESYKSISEYLEKCNFYTSLIAEAKFEKGARFHFWQHARLPLEFFKRYFFKLGFLDGEPGLIYALLSSYYVWLKYLKLRDLEDRP